MTKTFASTVTQLDLLTDAIKWLSEQTGVPFENLSNHMMVLGNVTRAIEQRGSNYGEPTEFDYDFEKYDWDDTYLLISEIWDN